MKSDFVLNVTESFSFEMTERLFGEDEVLYKPSSLPCRHIQACEIVPAADSVANKDFKSCLVLCRMADARELMDASPSSCFIAISKESRLPDWVQDDLYHSRIIVVKSKGRFMFYAVRLCEYLSEISAWEQALKTAAVHARANSRSIDPGVEVIVEHGSNLIRGSIYVTDAHFNLIAYREHSDARTKELQGLVEQGCFPPSVIEELSKHVFAKDNSREAAAYSKTISLDRHEYRMIHMPIFYGRSPILLITLFTSEPEGMEDSICNLVKSCLGSHVKFYQSRLEMAASPWTKLFERLIEGAAIDSGYVAAQLKLTDLAGAASFRLFCIDLSQCESLNDRAAIADLAKGTNGGKCYTFPYGNCQLVLCYQAVKKNRGYMLEDNADYLRQYVCKPFGARCSLSQPFKDLSKLALAYRQTQIALGFHEELSELLVLSLNENEYQPISFEFVLPFCLFEGEELDAELLSWTFENGIVAELIENDRAAGTHVTEVLWVYLKANCSPGTAARIMNVHRNTVVYHINKVAQTYTSEFDNPLVRLRIMLDYYYFIYKRAIIPQGDGRLTIVGV